MAARVGSATVEVNADLRKLFEGLDKAKRTSTEFANSAAKQFQNFVSSVRAADTSLAGLSAKSKTAAEAVGGLGSASTKTTTAIAGTAAAVTAAGVSLNAYINKSPTAVKALGAIGTAAAAVGVGLKAVADRAGPALATAWRFINHPVGIFALSAATGHPYLGAAMAIASTRAGPPIGRGIMAAGRAFASSPLRTLGIGAAGGFLGIAAVSAVAKAGGVAFDALKDGFKDARKAADDLKATIEALTKSAQKLSEELPKGNELYAARQRQLQGITGGLTSQFAYENRGLISSEVLGKSSEALEEFTLRLGNSRTAADTLAAALRNPERAMGLLADVGIRFNDEQRRTLAQTRTFEERLRNAGLVMDVVNQQLHRATTSTSGLYAAMYALGNLLGNLPGAIAGGIGQVISTITSEIGKLTGLVALVELLDNAFKGLASTLNDINLRLFGGPARQQLDLARRDLVEIERALTRVRQEAASEQARGDLLSGIFGGAARAEIANLERQREATQGTINRLEAEEFTRLRIEREAQERALNERVEERLRLLREELELMQAGTRAQLQAFGLAREFGLRRSDPRVQEAQKLQQEIENRRRIQAQAGQLSVFQRENIQLQHQIQLFRYGNEELQIRQRLLQIEMQAAQRRQPLTREQSQQLLDQLRTLQLIKQAADAIESAFSAAFNAMADALAQFATTGKFKFKDLADSIVQQLVRIAVQATVIRPLMNAITGFTNPLVGNLGSPGSTTSPMVIPKAGSFAEGGSFMVPGGRTGDQPYLIGLSAGEQVDVTPAKGRGGSGGVVINNVVNSSRDFEVESREREKPDGTRVIDQVFSEVTKRIGRGDMDTTFGARFGMRPRSIQR